MDITHKSQFVPLTITTDTANIAGSGYHSILFDNFGEQDAKIFFSYSDTEYFLLKAGESIVLGGRDPQIELADAFAVEFDALADAGINILRERIMVISKSLLTSE